MEYKKPEVTNNPSSRPPVAHHFRQFNIFEANDPPPQAQVIFKIHEQRTMDTFSEKTTRKTQP
jgi:hypothetical protein